jgi:hypothetical protein
MLSTNNHRRNHANINIPLQEYMAKLKHKNLNLFWKYDIVNIVRNNIKNQIDIQDEYKRIKSEIFASAQFRIFYICHTQKPKNENIN